MGCIKDRGARGRQLIAEVHRRLLEADKVRIQQASKPISEEIPMSNMTYAELRQVMKSIQDCTDYLEGKAHSNDIRALAEHAAKRAVMERQANLIERLRNSGLNLI